jgi:hypothetical protein
MGVRMLFGREDLKMGPGKFFWSEIMENGKE